MTLSGQMQAVQGESLDVLTAVLSARLPVALLDYPAHLNAGDSLIYRGELEYLRTLGNDVGYVSAVHTHDDRLLRERVPNGPILLHGGGNFGDRYPLHQNFREEIVARHRNRMIVQLPQTMDFTDDASLQRTRHVYGEHPNLHLLIRDRTGSERARTLFGRNHVHFCPDLAFGSGPLSVSSEPSNDVVLLKRRDGEARHLSQSVPDRLMSISYVTDWNVSTPYTMKWWLTTHAENGLHHVSALREYVYPHMRRAFDHQADVIVRSAIAVMSRGRVVVTDRLHAAIFATLLGKPVIMIDNVNRKLSAAHESYLGAFPDVRLARDFDHAADLVDTHFER